MKSVPLDKPRDPQGQRFPMETIVRLASIGLDRPLIDQTGLSGQFELKWDLGQMDMDRAAAPDAVSKVGVALASIEDALGLKAEAAKVMFDTVVVERAERPTGN